MQLERDIVEKAQAKVDKAIEIYNKYQKSGKDIDAYNTTYIEYALTLQSAVALVELGELENELSDDARQKLAVIDARIGTLMDIDHADLGIAENKGYLQSEVFSNPILQIAL